MYTIKKHKKSGVVKSQVERGRLSRALDKARHAAACEPDTERVEIRDVDGATLYETTASDWQ